MYTPSVLEEGIDEGRHGGSRSKKDQAAQHDQHNDDREQPEFLPFFQETPEF